MPDSSQSQSHQRFDGSVVRGLAPCKGWSLWSFDDQDSDGFWTKRYFARSAERDELLAVDRFDFEPTQERFDWLVRSGFPAPRLSPVTGAQCPWTNVTIDALIIDAEIEAARAAA